MKKPLLIMAALFLFSLFNHVKANTISISRDGANDTLTVSFRVNGNAACEANIEGALTSHTGIVSANWTSSTKMMTVKFLTASLQTSDLHTFLALAGYDTAELRAKQPAYDALDEACKYTRDPETE